MEDSSKPTIDSVMLKIAKEIIKYEDNKKQCISSINKEINRNQEITKATNNYKEVEIPNVQEIVKGGNVLEIAKTHCASLTSKDIEENKDIKQNPNSNAAMIYQNDQSKLNKAEYKEFQYGSVVLNDKTTQTNMYKKETYLSSELKDNNTNQLDNVNKIALPSKEGLRDINGQEQMRNNCNRISIQIEETTNTHVTERLINSQDTQDVQKIIDSDHVKRDHRNKLHETVNSSLEEKNLDQFHNSREQFQEAEYSQQFAEDEELFTSESTSYNIHSSLEPKYPNEKPGQRGQGLCIQNLNYSMQNFEIIQQFSKFGKITDYQRPRSTFCYIQYNDYRNQAKACQSLIKINGKVLKVEVKEEKKIKPNWKDDICKVFISGLDYYTKDSSIIYKLSKFGQVVDIYRPLPQANYRRRYITFSTPKEASRAANQGYLYINKNYIRIEFKDQPLRPENPSMVFITGYRSSDNRNSLIRRMEKFGNIRHVDWKYDACFITYAKAKDAKIADLAGCVRFSGCNVVIRHYYE